MAENNTGYKGFNDLLRVVMGGVHDGEPLDINFNLCSITGLPQYVKPNNTGDADYIPPVLDVESCGTPEITYFSTQKSASAQKNNCAPGSTGSTETIIVSAGSFTSTISQIDADNQAQAYADANSQSYANSNGTCILNPVITTFTWSLIHGNNPGVWNGFRTLINGTENQRIDYESSGNFNGIFRQGQIINIRQFSYEFSFPWPPDSTARMIVTVNGDIVFDNTVSIQTTELQNYTVNSDETTTSIDVQLIGNSTVSNYYSKAVTTNNAFAQDIVHTRIYDDTDGEFKLDVKQQPGDDHVFPFNVVGTTGTLHADITNNHTTESVNCSIYDGIITHNFTILPLTTHTFSSLHKDSLIITTT